MSEEIPVPAATPATSDTVAQQRRPRGRAARFGAGGTLRLLIGVAAIVIVISGMRAAKPFLVPLALAAFLSVTSLPLLRLLNRMRVPNAVAIPLVLLMILALLAGIGAIATNSLLQIQEQLPEYVARLSALYASALAWLTEHGVLDARTATDEAVLAPGRLVDLATALLRGFADFMSNVFLVAIITLFLLAEAAGVPRKMRVATGRADIDLGRYTRILAEIQRYLAIKTATSLGTGILIGIWAVIIGLDFPLFWGLSAFLLNYIPTIGSIIAAVPAIVLAFVQLGPGGMVLTAAGYLSVNTLIGNIIEPAVMGRGLGLSPFVVLVALLFWGWLWGPVGMLLSLPLTMVLKILLENSRELAWIAVLMGPAYDERRRRRAPAAGNPAPPGPEPRS